jgi:hypothetical protein
MPDLIVHRATPSNARAAGETDKDCYSAVGCTIAASRRRSSRAQGFGQNFASSSNIEVISRWLASSLTIDAIGLNALDCPIDTSPKCQPRPKTLHLPKSSGDGRGVTWSDRRRKFQNGSHDRQRADNIRLKTDRPGSLRRRTAMNRTARVLVASAILGFSAVATSGSAQAALYDSYIFAYEYPVYTGGNVTAIAVDFVNSRFRHRRVTGPGVVYHHGEFPHSYGVNPYW